MELLNFYVNNFTFWSKCSKKVTILGFKGQTIQKIVNFRSKFMKLWVFHVKNFTFWSKFSKKVNFVQIWFLKIKKFKNSPFLADI